MFFPGQAPDPLARLKLGFAGADGGPRPHLSVDGMTPAGPNLSHWPGNRTPAAFRADLSTGIALRFSRAPADEQARFLGDVEWVVNDHYDTDGFGSLLAILRHDVAIANEELLLSAAATGDFGCWQTWRGFAIDRIVKHLGDERSPVHGAFHGITDPDERTLQRYRWLLDHAPSVLRHPGDYRALYEQEMADVQAEITAGLNGRVELRRLSDIGLAALTTDGPRHRMTLNTLAGAYRVLHVIRAADGTRFRYHDRTESWFDLVTLAPPPRRDLGPLAARLRELEPDHDGGGWHADGPATPIPELYFGVAADQEYGEVTRELLPSRLPADDVLAACVEFFRGPSQMV